MTPDLTLRDIHVGKNRFSLRFRRDGSRTRFELLDGDASAVGPRAGSDH
jgi:hypothetical protein